LKASAKGAPHTPMQETLTGLAEIVLAYGTETWPTLVAGIPIFDTL